MSRHTNTGGRIDQELAALHGHAETRDRLKELGRSDEHIEDLESVSDGYLDCARTVAATVRHAQQSD
ncbi:hypothetical protein OB955_03720 [Halobacteria archaeon AArc-m2/3/4]|uniref:Uncharacterized protein n=1 Tax=Natronoglomus mannanivorans TaxID=2979990 RepID=A0ABT2QAA3_9EURY|nr:hypothetical protein [Halobacteria archaeon AArc-m2/3/4]